MDLDQIYARTIEVGDCRIWQTKQPRVRLEVGIAITASRAVYCVARGWSPSDPWIKGRLVWVNCGNPRCVENSHLSMGTRKQFSAWRARTGRCVPSPDARASMVIARRRRADNVCSEAIARAIRCDTRPSRVVAEEYHMSVANVNFIKRGVSWREAPIPQASIFNLAQSFIGMRAAA